MNCLLCGEPIVAKAFYHQHMANHQAVRLANLTDYTDAIAEVEICEDTRTMSMAEDVIAVDAAMKAANAKSS